LSDRIRRGTSRAVLFCGATLDARPPKRYAAGHISGATNIYWKDTVAGEDHPTLLPADMLRSILTSAGLKPDGRVLTYCEVGIQASHDYFVAKYLGYDAAMYDGSYHEWSMIKGLPSVKGTSAETPKP
jgi:thiosulfate/3-mercaptopyruvate sulfurtransferase